jgi:dTDP-4-amino-4,6-dideoxygalactose transaminase
LASASAIVLCGATPVFADVDPDSQNITLETIQAAVTSNTKAIICVHLAGWPCDMPAIMNYAKRHNLLVIEDCAQAHGAAINGKKVGSFGDMAAFSFCQDKIISTGGEGGMITTNNENLWRKAWSFKDHGKCYDAVHHQKHPLGFRWLHKSFGTNARMTEMQAAIGRIQLGRLDQSLAVRKDNADQYHQFLQHYPCFHLPKPDQHITHAYYKLYFYVKPEKLAMGVDRDAIMTALSSAGLACFSGSCSEIYKEQCFIDQPDLLPKAPLPEAKKLGDTALMLLVDPTVSKAKVASNIKIMERVFKELNLEMDPVFCKTRLVSEKETI